MKIRDNQIIILFMLTFLFSSIIVATPTMTLCTNSTTGLSRLNIISDVTPLLTWTSRTQTESLPISNNSNLIGDHVLVNATFPKELNVTSCEMRIWTDSVSVNYTSSSNSATVVIDTYYVHHQNQTYNIQVIGNSTDNDTWIIYRHDVEICNFFKPHVTVPSPEPLLIDDRTFNITWSCIDSNEEEVNIYSVWFSNNDGASFNILAPNVTKTWITWNSTGWLEQDYMIRVRAHSIDLTYPGLDLGDPPTGYLPGDFSDGFGPSFDSTPPPPPETTTTVTTSITDGVTTTNSGTDGVTTTTNYTDGVTPDYTLIIIINGFIITFLIVVIVFVCKKRG